MGPRFLLKAVLLLAPPATLQTSQHCGRLEYWNPDNLCCASCLQRFGLPPCSGEGPTVHRKGLCPGVAGGWGGELCTGARVGEWGIGTVTQRGAACDKGPRGRRGRGVVKPLSMWGRSLVSLVEAGWKGRGGV